ASPGAPLHAHAVHPGPQARIPRRAGPWPRPRDVCAAPVLPRWWRDDPPRSALGPEALVGLTRKRRLTVNVLERDFFSDPEIIRDPNPYYAALHELGPVMREPHHGVFMISGSEEILAMYADLASFSSIVAPLGPFTKLPERAEGESIADVIEHRRAEIPLSDLLPTLDPPTHTRQRALLNKPFTPNRTKENGGFMGSLADGLIDEFADRGEAEFCGAYAGPFTLLVIADLLGVPREHHDTFRGWLGKTVVADTEGKGAGDPVFLNLYPYFTRYIEERRASRADDVMSQLATARFPDGELPAVKDLVSLAAILFAAGQETTARLLSTGMRILA